MKKIWLVVLPILVLAGCSSPEWESVHDDLPAQNISVWQQEAYEITIGLPEHAETVLKTDHAACYSTENGEVEVETISFLASSVDRAIEQLSGFPADQLTVLKTERFHLPEYQFAWVSQTEQGARLYRADLVMDGSCCYAVICSNLEQAGDLAAFEARKVFATFGLQSPESI